MRTIRHLDLQDTVKPLVSIDEYSPKLGDEREVIVLGFFCMNAEVANDLSDFLHKSAADILDVEASDGASETGDYMVFVEIKRDAGFWADFFKIIKDVERLTGSMNWESTTYLHALPLPIEQLREKGLIITDPENYLTKKEFDQKVRDHIKSFFETSGASETQISEGVLTAKSGIYEITAPYYAIMDTDTATIMFEQEQVIVFEDMNIRKLKKIFENCSVYQTQEKIYIDNQQGEVLVLKRHYE